MDIRTNILTHLFLATSIGTAVLGSPLVHADAPTHGPPRQFGLPNNIQDKGDRTWDSTKFQTWPDSSLPSQMDLSWLIKSHPIQQRGYTCHSHAASALYEAACAKKTGGRYHPQVSEAYLYYLQLKQKLRRYPLAFIIKPLEEPKLGRLTPMDSGWADFDFRNLSRFGAVSRAEFPLTGPSLDNFSQKVKDLFLRERKRYVPSPLKSEAEAWLRFPEDFKARRDAKTRSLLDSAQRISRELDEYVLGHIPNRGETRKDGAVLGRTRSRSIRACSELPFRMFSIPGSETNEFLMVSLLAHGVPFICSGHLYHRYLDQTIYHVITVLGYRPTSLDGDLMDPSTYEFLARDSLDGTQTWGTYDLHSGCSEGILYLE